MILKERHLSPARDVTCVQPTYVVFDNSYCINLQYQRRYRSVLPYVCDLAFNMLEIVYFERSSRYKLQC